MTPISEEVFQDTTKRGLWNRIAEQDKAVAELTLKWANESEELHCKVAELERVNKGIARLMEDMQRDEQGLKNERDSVERLIERMREALKYEQITKHHRVGAVWGWATTEDYFYGLLRRLREIAAMKEEAT